MLKVFIDTWAWCALVNKKDAAHESAKRLNKELLEQNYLFITTNFVLDETYTLIRSRIGYKAAIDFGNKIRSSRKFGVLKIITIDEETEEEAWKLFVKYKDIERLSFTDCTSFAVMKQLGLQEAFTGDRHFQRAGFITKP